MENKTSPNIDSFVLRFVEEQPTQAAGGAAYHGYIRHVQSDQEIGFTRWEDAVSFINKFVPFERFYKSERPQNTSDQV
jgi:hypothetical protein